MAAGVRGPKGSLLTSVLFPKEHNAPAITDFVGARALGRPCGQMGLSCLLLCHREAEDNAGPQCSGSQRGHARKREYGGLRRRGWDHSRLECRNRYGLLWSAEGGLRGRWD